MLNYFCTGGCRGARTCRSLPLSRSRQRDGHRHDSAPPNFDSTRTGRTKSRADQEARDSDARGSEGAGDLRVSLLRFDTCWVLPSLMSSNSIVADALSQLHTVLADQLLSLRFSRLDLDRALLNTRFCFCSSSLILFSYPVGSHSQLYHAFSHGPAVRLFGEFQQPKGSDLSIDPFSCTHSSPLITSFRSHSLHGDRSSSKVDMSPMKRRRVPPLPMGPNGKQLRPRPVKDDDSSQELPRLEDTHTAGSARTDKRRDGPNQSQEGGSRADRGSVAEVEWQEGDPPSWLKFDTRSLPSAYNRLNIDSARGDEEVFEALSSRMRTVVSLSRSTLRQTGSTCESDKIGTLLCIRKRGRSGLQEKRRVRFSSWRARGRKRRRPVFAVSPFACTSWRQTHSFVKFDSRSHEGPSPAILSSFNPHPRANRPRRRTTRADLESLACKKPRKMPRRCDVRTTSSKPVSPHSKPTSKKHFKLETPKRLNETHCKQALTF